MVNNRTTLDVLNCCYMFSIDLVIFGKQHLEYVIKEFDQCTRKRMNAVACTVVCRIQLT